MSTIDMSIIDNCIIDTCVLALSLSNEEDAFSIRDPLFLREVCKYYNGKDIDKVERYKYKDYEDKKKAMLILKVKERFCTLEQHNIPISLFSVVWRWGNHDFQKTKKEVEPCCQN